MPPVLRFLLLVSSGWVSRQQQEVIEYLRVENPVLWSPRPTWSCSLSAGGCATSSWFCPFPREHRGHDADPRAIREELGPSVVHRTNRYQNNCERTETLHQLLLTA